LARERAEFISGGMRNPEVETLRLCIPDSSGHLANGIEELAGQKDAEKEGEREKCEDESPKPLPEKVYVIRHGGEGRESEGGVVGETRTGMPGDDAKTPPIGDPAGQREPARTDLLEESPKSGVQRALRAGVVDPANTGRGSDAPLIPLQGGQSDLRQGFRTLDSDRDELGSLGECGEGKML